MNSSYPTLPPPLSEENRISWLRLLRSRRVGVSTFFKLMREHGTAEACLEALPALASASGVTSYKTCSRTTALAEYRAAQAAGATMVCIGDAAYPSDLAMLSDAPPFLWCIGDATLLQRPMVALIGARNASSLGSRMAQKLAHDLTDAGYVVVSGLARGIDTAAHVGALDGGTVAVQAGGVDIVYPRENADLAHKIERQGLRISEGPMGMQPQARHFPQRNRIVSGLSRATIVVEAASKSGSLITARTALDQGRDVLAVPGHPFDARASGTNMLIRDGAPLVRGIDDILEVIGEAPELVTMTLPQNGFSEPAPRGLRVMAALHSQILSRLSPSPVSEDQLIRDLDAPASAVSGELVLLEADGQVERAPGGLLSVSK